MAFLLIIFLFIIVYLAYCSYKINKAYMLAKTVYNKNAEIGSKSKSELKLLIVGDSVGTGVGASCFETSVTGRIAGFLGKSHHIKLTNASANGSKIADLLKMPVPKEKQDLAILFVSSNDSIRFTNLKIFKENAIKVLEKYSKLSKKVITIGPANVGLAPMLPLPLRIIYLYTGPKYAYALEEASANFKNVIYINSLKPPKRLGKYVKSYYSPDKFHPNDEGHKFWFEMVKDYS